MTRATTYPIVLLLLTIMTKGPAAADAPIMVQAIASRDASSSIISINLESGAQFELVPSGPARASLVLVSARDELLFFETGHDNTQDIIAHCLKTGRRQVVHRTGKQRAATLAADPTGSRLYYCVGERETGPCGWFMVSVDRDGGPDQVPRSVFQRPGHTIQYPRLAPDGRSMLVAYYPGHSWSPNFEIHHAVIQEDGTLGEPRQITRNSLIDLCPAVMPDGRMVWLSQELNGPTWLMIARDDGTQAQTLHATPGRHVTLTRPVVADEWICFAENQGQDAVIVLMRSDGSVAGRYTVEGFRISDPVIAAGRTGRADSREVAVLPPPGQDRLRAAFFLPRKFDVPSGRWSLFNPEIRKAKATIRHFEGRPPGVPLGVRLYHDSQLGSIATEVQSAEWLIAFEDAFAIIHEEAGRAGFEWRQVANWDYGNLTIATRQALVAYASDLNSPGISCVRSELVQDFVDELMFLLAFIGDLEPGSQEHDEAQTAMQDLSALYAFVIQSWPVSTSAASDPDVDHAVATGLQALEDVWKAARDRDKKIDIKAIRSFRQRTQRLMSTIEQSYNDELARLNTSAPFEQHLTRQKREALDSIATLLDAR